MGSVLSRVGRSGSKSTAGKGEFVEAVVCKESELTDNELRVCDLAGEGKVLVVKHDGKISALGTKCSHYGAPLEKGVLANGRVRCPWHGACFNVGTGDIEDFPGLDGIPCYQAMVDGDGAVRVRARRDLLQANKCSKQLGKRSEASEEVIVVLGGGGAGASCVEAARESGFTGRLVLATREKHLPYDRPKLSKALDMSAEKLRLRTPEFYKAADIEVLTEHEAESVNAEEKKVRFTDGTEISYTALVVATGSKPRTLEVPGADLQNIRVLRTPDDGNVIADLIPGKNVVIVGTSFIGMEAASYCIGKAGSVTVVGTGSVPFARSLGPEIGAMLQTLHTEKGVVVKNSLNVTEFKGEDGKLTQVVLSDGTELPADVCLLGVGALPCTEILKDVVELDERGYVVVDKRLRSSVESILAAGDIASFPLPLTGGERVAIGHWQLAHYLGSVAGRNAAGKDAEVSTVPFFWTMQYGKSIRYTGYCPSFDDVLYDGDVAGQKFVAFFCQGDQVKGVASLGRDPAAAFWAERFSAGGYPSKQSVQDELAAAAAAAAAGSSDAAGAASSSDAAAAASSSDAAAAAGSSETAPAAGSSDTAAAGAGSSDAAAADSSSEAAPAAGYSDGAAGSSDAATATGCSDTASTAVAAAGSSDAAATAGPGDAAVTDEAAPAAEK